MIINLTYDASVSGAPAGFQPTAQSVADFFAARFKVNFTIGLQLGWGTLGGVGLPGGILATTLSSETPTTFSALRTALTANALSANAQAFIASIQGADPTGGGAAVTSLSNAIILGLNAPGGVNGFSGFGTGFSYTFNLVSGGSVTPGTFDMWGVMAHELSEALGRFRLGNVQGGKYYSLDLMSFTAPATRAWAGTTVGSYCSTNGGVTNLDFFNRNASFDFGDYAGARVDCANAVSSTGVSQPWTSVDDLVMDALGYEFTSNPSNVGKGLSGFSGHSGF